jgi:hypothetical protein
MFAICASAFLSLLDSNPSRSTIASTVEAAAATKFSVQQANWSLERALRQNFHSPVVPAHPARAKRNEYSLVLEKRMETLELVAKDRWARYVC